MKQGIGITRAGEINWSALPEEGVEVHTDLRWSDQSAERCHNSVDPKMCRSRCQIDGFEGTQQ